MANPQESGQTQNFSYGLPAAILAPVPSQAVKEESPSYQWPDGKVKLECTTGQEPEGWDDQEWMWRSSGPRKLGLPEDAFKVDKRVCLGVFHCACSSDAGDPIRFFRPKKEKVARDKQRSETCHICHSTLTYVSCTASLTYYMYKDHEDIQHSVRQHSGRHEHGRPPIKVLPAADRAVLDRQVRENPSLTAQQLRAGGGPTQIALGDINPALLSARKARTEVENSKVRQGIAAPATTRNSGFQLLDSLSTLQDSFETPWIVKSDLNWHENDGRAPDTRERLAALQKIEDEFTARNSTLTDAERWTACNSGPALLIVPPPPPSNSTPPSLLFRQSYVWDANSCFIDAPLEAYFRAFIVMGDAVRGDLLRRIRTEAPDTGLRDVFEHLWLRGLLSGAIISRSSTVTKPSSTKLMHALQAGQLNVKRLISSKWDGGEFALGMPGCSRTWLNQMISTETTRDIQKYFGISHTVNYTCNSKHSTKIPSDVSVENGIHQGDIFLAHSYTDEGSYRPSLIDYLIHAIPRQRHGASRTDSWPPLHVGAPIPCSHRSCNASEAAVTSITTEWPLILRIDPILHARTMAFDPETPDVACPLILNLGSDVQYTLIARVIYLGPQAEGTIGHYVTKTRLKDSTYMYNDRRRGGLLTELGPLHLLEDHEPNTSFVVYLRTSKSSKTSRTIDEIQTDYAKIPIRPIEPVIPVSDDDTEEELGQIIDQMLIDTITSPPKNAWTSSPPANSEHFYTPEQSPLPQPHNALNAAADTSHAVRRTMLNSPVNNDIASSSTGTIRSFQFGEVE
ncbi:hypothetical protein B0H13DRAFT_2392309 [Mycena leptocephala]|nr:hypothetical protein B0H13DRAFT_2392309 [Mycena leptocephala]